MFAGQHWQASVIMQMLEDNNIQAFLKDELMSSIEPWLLEAGGLNTVKVIVSDNFYEAAQKLVEEYNNAPDLPAEEAS